MIACGIEGASGGVGNEIHRFTGSLGRLEASDSEQDRGDPVYSASH